MLQLSAAAAAFSALNPCLLAPHLRPHQVADFTAADKAEEGGAPAAAAPAAAPAPAPVPVAPAPEKAKPVLPATKPLEPPEEEQYTVHIPEGLTALDLDTIKLTAQFVARNGKLEGRPVGGGGGVENGVRAGGEMGRVACRVEQEVKNAERSRAASRDV